MNSKEKNLEVGGSHLPLEFISEELFKNQACFNIQLPDENKIERNRNLLERAIDRDQVIYGVTTGFGDSSRRTISKEHAIQLQENLISYLLCGTGPLLPKTVCRMVTLFRLHSLSRGVSAISFDLLKRMQWMVENDVIPQIPSQGSLGASGDLVPLAYLAQAIQGQGQVWYEERTQNMQDVLRKFDLPPYTLKAKEGLALVNGTTVMAAYSHYNTKVFRFLLKTCIKSTAFTVLGLKGHKEAFNPLINSVAKQFPGQSVVAEEIFKVLIEEDHKSPENQKVSCNEEREITVQDKYSIRCAPQILGPIFETLKMAETWTSLEVSGVSDNPIIDEGETFSMGGNFYGGYISHAMDYLKISMAHMADMIDRQFMCLVDESTNRGLPPNLAHWDEIPKELRFLNHGLKGLNQAMSAITSEMMAQSQPGGIHSRSSESHNQDKVSLGLSACVQMNAMFENMFTLLAIHLIGCAQAADLRKLNLKSKSLNELYQWVRESSEMVTQDRPLDCDIKNIAMKLKQQSGCYNELKSL